VDLAPEVAEALAGGRPVVALESTLVAYGFRPPRGVEVALELEAIVRRAGAVPATVGILAGRLRVGLSGAEPDRLAHGARKVSPRDFAAVLAAREDGATTVAGTLWIAHRAGIQVLATGGIGGVHRGGGRDVSADLPALATTPVAVVCAGAKAILDLEATLEWLETHGVPVVGWGCRTLPGFFVRETGLPLPQLAAGANEVARLACAHWALGMASAVLAVVPAPAASALPREAAEAAIADALREAAAAGVTGKLLTPFLLARVAELTGGRSEQSNLELLRHNAAQGAALARAVAVVRAPESRTPVA
jgi:pseudouridine-5'-phosphate glycosidase